MQGSRFFIARQQNIFVCVFLEKPPSKSCPMFNNFWNFTDQFVLFTQSEKEKIKNRLTLRDVPKNYTLVDLGDTAKEVFFLNKGCMRMYYLTDDGKEITGFIYQENMFAGSHESFFSQVPSMQILETLEPCELVVLSYRDLNQLYIDVPKMNVLTRKILEQRMAFAQKVVASLIINKPSERYVSFLEQYPNLVNRIPHHILATYMGITPVSMSRIRKRIMKKK